MKYHSGARMARVTGARMRVTAAGAHGVHGVGAAAARVGGRAPQRVRVGVGAAVSGRLSADTDH